MAATSKEKSPFDKISGLLGDPGVRGVLKNLGNTGSGGSDFKVSDQLHVPFGLSFEQGQKLVGSIQNRDIAQAEIDAQKRMGDLEAQKVANQRKATEAQIKATEHQMKMNNLSDTDKLRAEEQQAALGRENAVTLQEQRITADQTLQQDRFDEAKRVTDEQSRRQLDMSTPEGQMFDLQKQQILAGIRAQNANAAANYASVQLSRFRQEAEQYKATTGNTFVPDWDSYDRVQKSAIDYVTALEGGGVDVMSPEDRKVALDDYITDAWSTGMIPAELMKGHMSPSLYEDFDNMRKAVNSGDPLQIGAAENVYKQKYAQWEQDQFNVRSKQLSAGERGYDPQNNRTFIKEDAPVPVPETPRETATHGPSSIGDVVVANPNKYGIAGTGYGGFGIVPSPTATNKASEEAAANAQRAIDNEKWVALIKYNNALKVLDKSTNLTPQEYAKKQTSLRLQLTNKYGKDIFEMENPNGN